MFFIFHGKPQGYRVFSRFLDMATQKKLPTLVSFPFSYKTTGILQKAPWFIDCLHCCQLRFANSKGPTLGWKNAGVSIIVTQKMLNFGNIVCLVISILSDHLLEQSWLETGDVLNISYKNITVVSIYILICSNRQGAEADRNRDSTHLLVFFW